MVRLITLCLSDSDQSSVTKKYESECLQHRKYRVTHFTMNLTILSVAAQFVPLETHILKGHERHKQCGYTLETLF